jgi:VacB/RNase II family 3'-5' exoribonuclease
MLDENALSQLKGLKTQIEAQKEYAEATVKGTRSRFGFAILDDSREIFIPPDEMLKVFPGDRIRVCIQPDQKNKLYAQVQKLLDSPIGDFNGQCVTKGQAVFIEADLPRLSRWLFIPPHARNGIKEGDYARCAILRHPIRDGKPQSKVLSILGNDTHPGIESLYSETKYGLDRKLSGECERELKALLDSPPDQQNPIKRRDLRDLPFVSIDSAHTLDIDDALCAEATDSGWMLYVAIADPTELIVSGSALEKEAERRATSAYLPGDVVTMLPTEISHQLCSLAEGKSRKALVCKIAVSDSGDIEGHEFFEALVRSGAKLSYSAVESYLIGGSDELISNSAPLEALYQVYRKLRENRESEGLIMQDRREYRLVLNDKKKIDRIDVRGKMISQKLVEECMILANRCAALFLKENKCSGPFICHAGFRSDRSEQAKKLLKAHLAGYKESDTDIHTLTGYRDVMRSLTKSKQKLPLRSIVNRLLSRAEIKSRAEPHMGMSLHCYTNFTSPLRRYTDFLVHRQIKAAINKRAITNYGEEYLTGLYDRQNIARQASRETEQWLICQYAEQFKGKTLAATLCHINSNGFTVRTFDTGIEGFIDLREHPDKFSFDQLTMTLKSKTQNFQLEQALRVVLKNVDMKNREIIFTIAVEQGKEEVR